MSSLDVCNPGKILPSLTLNNHCLRQSSHNSTPSKPSTMTEQEKEEAMVRWADSNARKILVANLEAGNLPLYAADLGPKDAWEQVYWDCPEFKDMTYPQFCNRLNSIRKAFNKRMMAAQSNKAALAHDQKLHPQKPTDSDGKPVFHLSSALRLL